jgi:hypothetical protein
MSAPLSYRSFRTSASITRSSASIASLN